MSVLKIVVLLSLVCLNRAAPTKHNDIKSISAHQQQRINEWNDDNKENIWELSGQFEGDIVLDTRHRNGLIGPTKLWVDNTVIYGFQGNFSAEQEAFVERTLKQFEEVSCLRLRKWKPYDPDYVVITSESGGCHSKVGRAGGAQQLNLQPNEIGMGCFKPGTILHEFLHAMGFYHQQSASDRDDFVEIVTENIEKGTESNFNKYNSSYVTDFGVKYDYGSILHYSAYAFSKNGEKTIIQKEPTPVIGQRDGLSQSDILKLNRMYKCNDIGNDISDRDLVFQDRNE